MKYPTLLDLFYSLPSPSPLYLTRFLFLPPPPPNHTSYTPPFFLHPSFTPLPDWMFYYHNQMYAVYYTIKINLSKLKIKYFHSTNTYLEIVCADKPIIIYKYFPMILNVECTKLLGSCVQNFDQVRTKTVALHKGQTCIKVNKHTNTLLHNKIWLWVAQHVFSYVF